MAALPTGTVTFLFTDVEGSTRLWEEHPDAARRALMQHDAIVEFLVRIVAAVEAALAPAALARELAAGRALSLDEAVAEALRDD